MDESYELEILEFWQSDLHNIPKIPESLKDKVTDKEAIYLLSRIQDLGKNLQANISNYLTKLKERRLQKEEIEIQKRAIDLKYSWKVFLKFGLFVIIIIVSTIISIVVPKIIDKYFPSYENTTVTSKKINSTCTEICTYRFQQLNDCSTICD